MNRLPQLIAISGRQRRFASWMTDVLVYIVALNLLVVALMATRALFGKAYEALGPIKAELERTGWVASAPIATQEASQ